MLAEECTRPDALQFVLPEHIAHAFLTLLFLLSGQWVAFLLNAPLLAFNINKCAFFSQALSCATVLTVYATGYA